MLIEETTTLYSLGDYLKLMEIVEDKPFFEYNEGIIYWRYSQKEVPEEILDFIFSPAYDWHQFMQLTLQYHLEMKSKNHDQITYNLIAQISKQLDESKYNVYSESPNLKIPEKEKSRVPDVCATSATEEKRNENNLVENPLVNIEILSRSTQKIDKTEKLEEYRAIPSLQEYIMIEQEKIGIEQHIRKGKNKWEVNLLDEKDKNLQIKAIEVEVELAKIYNKVVFKKK
jgi:Uma2 family endonuclease